MVFIEADIQHLCNKGKLEIPLSELGIRADDASDMLQELILIDLPFNISLKAKHNDFIVRVEMKELFSKEKGYYIYRYFVDDEEVYLGRTNRPAKRYLEHCRQNPIYKTVNGIDIHKCESRNDMIFLERLLIGEECPPWNQVDAELGKLSYPVPEVDYIRYTPFEVMQRYE